MSGNPAAWFVASILLLAGASTVLDPERMAWIPHGVSLGLRNFEEQLRYGRQLWNVEPPRELTSAQRTKWRFAGVAMIALGLFVAVAQG